MFAVCSNGWKTGYNGLGLQRSIRAQLKVMVRRILKKYDCSLDKQQMAHRNSATANKIAVRAYVLIV